MAKKIMTIIITIVEIFEEENISLEFLDHQVFSAAYSVYAVVYLRCS